MDKIIESLYRISNIKLTEANQPNELIPEEQVIFNTNESFMGPDGSLEQIDGKWVLSDWYDETVFDSTQEMIEFCKENISYIDDDLIKEHLEDNTWEYSYTPEEVKQIRNYLIDELKNRM